MSFKKLVSSIEYKFNQIASDNDISPKILSAQNIRDSIRISSEKYETTLLEYHDDGGNISVYEEKIKALIDKLHKLGIFHGDLHGNNIVINPETGEVRLIDYGKSIMIEKVEKNLKKINKFLEPETPFTCLKEVLDFEYTMYKRDF